MDDCERDQLAHLANDWDAMAAQLERQPDAGLVALEHSRTLRECAGQLRDRVLRLRALAPRVLRDVDLVSRGPVLDPSWPQVGERPPG